MSILLSRRSFLTSLAAGGVLIATPEPVRRFWQVPGNAPVGGPQQFMGMDPAFPGSVVVYDPKDVAIYFNDEKFEWVADDADGGAWGGSRSYGREDIERVAHEMRAALPRGFALGA